ncbi:MAG TPA: 23S rRNA (pseudouridine(1915)-N(3))-methyltransferase RlmH [Deltaproteobacteria bacterium]|nr:23S rRNA (pseudouridine(1915)-N(3))-methyltransferase RlmH [Deltaproteobacteria bacterium]
MEEYRKRITKYGPVEVIETKNIRSQTREGVHVVLAPGGNSLTSEGLAQLLDRHLNAGTKNLFFYTGGPDGFPAEVLEKADLSLSLSCMTFNHQLIRVMLLEQVYRAFTIIHREPYHR